MDLNRATIMGRATNAIQVKTIESTGTPVVNFTVVTNRKYKNKEGNLMEDAEFHRCVAYGKSAEILGKYLTKWKRIYVEARIRTRRRQDAAGVEKYTTELVVDNFIFLDSKSSDEFQDPATTDETPTQLSTEDIPF